MGTLPRNFLRTKIKSCVDNYNYDNAIFLCERLQAKDPSPYHTYLIADCYFRKGLYNRTHSVLQDIMKEIQYTKTDPVSMDIRYLYAKASVILEKYQDGKRALLGKKFIMSKEEELKLLLKTAMPRGAAGFALLAEIEQKMGNQTMARNLYAECVRTDGFYWTAWEQLCRMNGNPKAEEVFSVSHLMRGSHIPLSSRKAKDGVLNVFPYATANKFDSTSVGRPPFNNPLTPISVAQCEEPCKSPNECSSSSQVNSTHLTFPSETLAMSGSPKIATLDFNLNDPSEMLLLSPFTLSMNVDTLQSVSAQENSTIASQFQVRYPATASAKSASVNTCPDVLERSGKVVDIEENLRLSRKTSSRVGTRKRGHSALGRTLPNMELASSKTKRRAINSPEGMVTDKIVDESEDYSTQDLKEFEELSSLFLTLGRAYVYQCQYKCREALELYQSLPHAQRNTGYVIGQIAQSWFEMSKYIRAVQHFEKMQRVAPWRLEGLELMSTALWHLKDKVKLSYLAQKLKNFDLNSPVTWMVVGNLHSLKKEHNSALQLFKRAITLDKFNVYGYTLCAHELVENKDFDKAILGYRQAITIDQRHYKAWYGLGSLYQSQEKFDIAEYHYRQAIKIHPRNSVICCCLGMTYCAAFKFNDALDVLSKAESMAPENFLVKFYKATVYEQLEDYESALRELKAVVEICQKETPVYLLMGKIYTKLKLTEKAMLAFDKAINLNPKDENKVKQILDALNENGETGDDDWGMRQ